MVRENDDNAMYKSNTFLRVKPYNLKYYDDIEPNRIVIYREEGRQIVQEF